MSAIAAKRGMRRDIQVSRVPRKSSSAATTCKLYPIISRVMEKNTPRGMVKSCTAAQPFFCDCDY